MKSLLRKLSVSLVLCLAFPAFGADEGWVELFNGKDVQGWAQHSGKAVYTVKDGALVGTTVMGTGNSFLCPPGTYKDFVLEYEFKVAPQMNSGVQIRSEVFDSAKTLQVDGKEIKVPADRVHGYQVEIDMDPKNDRWWTAGIYDEARRGWLFPGTAGGDKKAFTEQGRKISKQNEWNKVRVEAKGPSIKTYLNGELRVEIEDSMTLSGILAFQVHGIGKDKEKEGQQIMWQNIRLKKM